MAAASSFEVPDTLSVHGLAYDDLTGTMAFITLGDAGMSICRIDTCSGRIAPITQPGYTSIYNLRAGAGKLTFNSIASGYDEVHVYDLARGEEFRVTTSRYGSVSPSAPVPGSDKLYMTTYARSVVTVFRTSVWTAIRCSVSLIPVCRRTLSIRRAGNGM
ncbi:MAG: hypothetical protein ACLTZY_02115 [Alistipes indistinctus]